MKGKQTHFFATRADLSLISQICEHSKQIKYILFGLFDESYLNSYSSLLDWKNVGSNLKGNTTSTECFLVLEREATVNFEVVPQRKGGIKYSVDQSRNPTSIIFRPSGLYNETSLIAGNLGTISTHPTSIELYNLFRKTIQKHSKKVGNYYVAEDALELMKQGVRMVTMGIDSPSEYDLKFR